VALSPLTLAGTHADQIFATWEVAVESSETEKCPLHAMELGQARGGRKPAYGI
jgi:hypothetical protein